MEWLKPVGAWLGRAAQTSEFKACVFAALWAVTARFIPSIPVEIPVDLTAAGMGSIVASPGALVAYALVRVVIKVFTDGQMPFQPTDKPPSPEAT